MYKESKCIREHYITIKKPMAIVSTFVVNRIQMEPISGTSTIVVCIALVLLVLVLVSSLDVVQCWADKGDD